MKKTKLRASLNWKNVFLEAARYFFFAVYALLIFGAVYGAGKGLGLKARASRAVSSEAVR